MIFGLRVEADHLDCHPCRVAAGIVRWEWSQKDAVILMRGHQLTMAKRERSRAHSRLTRPDRAWLMLLAGTVPTECLAAISSARRECLDPMLITSRRHLRQVLSHHVEHYNVHRPHRARNLRPPDSDGNLTAPVTDPTAARIRRRRVLGHLRTRATTIRGGRRSARGGAEKHIEGLSHPGCRCSPADQLETSTRHDDALIIQHCRSEPTTRFWYPTGLIAVQLALMAVIGLIADVLLHACG
jgi:integrase-like protein